MVDAYLSFIGEQDLNLKLSINILNFYFEKKFKKIIFFIIIAYWLKEVLYML